MTRDRTKKVKDWFLAISPDEWWSNIALMDCSEGAQCAFMHLLMWMQCKSPQRGYFLKKSGAPGDGEWLAKVMRKDPEKAKAYLAELESSGVLDRDHNGVLWSPRMVRTEEKRAARSHGGKARARQMSETDGDHDAHQHGDQDGPNMLTNMVPHIELSQVELGKVDSEVDLLLDPESRPSTTELTRAELLQMQAQQLLREAREGTPAESTKTEQVSADPGQLESISEQPREPEGGDKECHSEVLEGELVEWSPSSAQDGHHHGNQVRPKMVTMVSAPSGDQAISTKLTRHPMPDPFGMRSDTILAVSGVELSPQNSSNMRSVAGYPEPPPQPQRFLRSFGAWDGRGAPGPWAQLAIQAWNEGHAGRLLTEPDPSPQTRHRDIELHRLMVDLDLMPEDLGLVALGLSKSAWHRGENDSGFVADISWACSSKNRSKASKHLELGRRYASGQWVPEDEQRAQESRARALRYYELTEKSGRKERK